MRLLLHDKDITRVVDVLPIPEDFKDFASHAHIREDCGTILPQKQTALVTCEAFPFSRESTPCYSSESNCHRAKVDFLRPDKARIVKGAKPSQTTLGRVTNKASQPVTTEGGRDAEVRAIQDRSAFPYPAITANALKTAIATGERWLQRKAESYQNMGVLCLLLVAQMVFNVRERRN